MGNTAAAELGSRRVVSAELSYPQRAQTPAAGQGHAAGVAAAPWGRTVHVLLTHPQTWWLAVQVWGAVQCEEPPPMAGRLHRWL